MSVHTPHRPDWMCLGCGVAWPCPSRRPALLAEFHEARVSLHIYLSGCFVTAAQDLPDQLAGDLYRRFLGWLHRPPAGRTYT